MFDSFIGGVATGIAVIGFDLASGVSRYLQLRRAAQGETKREKVKENLQSTKRRGRKPFAMFLRKLFCFLTEPIGIAETR